MEDNKQSNSGNSISWRDLLEDYTKRENKKPNESSEKESINLFLNYIKTDDKPTANIPKFYYKRPISYNDLYFSVKSEAKSRFLSLKSFEIPQKKRNLINLII
jgi:hypothetical protein